MLVKFRERFDKDIHDITDKDVLDSIIEVIENVELAKKPQDITNIKKMKGHKQAYRIRIGNYRIGVFIEKGVVEFARVLQRKDIYKKFP